MSLLSLMRWHRVESGAFDVTCQTGLPGRLLGGLARISYPAYEANTLAETIRQAGLLLCAAPGPSVPE